MIGETYLLSSKLSCGPRFQIDLKGASVSSPLKLDVFVVPHKPIEHALNIFFSGSDYPDANHGFLDQYPELFADHVRAFLNAR